MGERSSVSCDGHLVIDVNSLVLAAPYRGLVDFEDVPFPSPVAHLLRRWLTTTVQIVDPVGHVVGVG
jgi:hypothetical protein